MPKPNPTKRREVGPLVDAPEKWRDMVGQRLGRLEVVGYTGRSRRPGEKLFACKCSCGWFIDANAYSLTSGNTTSCGCAHSDAVAARNSASATHGHARGGKTSPEYKAWSSMIRRCTDPKNDHYADYGGRGITVCAAWMSFETFLRDMGLRPGREYSLERLDNNLGYFPTNTDWATAKQQCRNQRSNVLHEIDGDRRTLGEWAEIYDADPDLLYVRVVRRGWELATALLTPPRAGKPLTRSRFRGRWAQMVARCTDPRHSRYADYGGRGIKVCPRYMTFEGLESDLGYPPSDLFTLDRADNSLGYDEGNVIWATYVDQIRNRRNSRLYELGGEQRPLKEWSDLAQMPYGSVKRRVYAGWSLSEALGTPLDGGHVTPDERCPWVRK